MATVTGQKLFNQHLPPAPLRIQLTRKRFGGKPDWTTNKFEQWKVKAILILQELRPVYFTPINGNTCQSWLYFFIILGQSGFKKKKKTVMDMQLWT